MALSRSDTILKLIVEHFVKKAQPVGSQTLIDEYQLPYSSATIRNEMYALEKMGLIEKTHSSSGRVPSAQGYRYYCEHLRDHSIEEEFKNSIQVVLDKKIKSVEEIIKASCEILSHMTSLVSVVMGPDEKDEKLASVQLVQISENTITAIFVTDKGYVENKTFIVPNELKASDLVSCVNILNERLKGTPILKLVEKMEAIKPVLSEYVVSHDVIYQALLETFVRFASDRLSLYGREELFNNPEFKNDTDKLEKVFRLLGDSNAFKKMENEMRKGDADKMVKIGDVEGNPDLSIVSTKVKYGEDGESTIALLGPTRMDYDKVISSLEYIAEALNGYFKDINNKGGNNDA